MTKALIYVSLLFFLVAGTAWGDGEWQEKDINLNLYPIPASTTIQKVSPTERFQACDIEQLAKDGKICEVLGHDWNYSALNYIRHRSCRFCDKYQIEADCEKRWQDKIFPNVYP